MKTLISSLILSLSLIFSIFGQNISPLQITFQPRPAMPENYGTLDAQGTITLRVEFMENGQIEKIVPVNSLTNTLTQNAIEAAKKIEFKPEIKDGRPVTAFKQIQYIYSWDYGWKDSNQNLNKTPFQTDEKADAIVKRAVEKLGGNRYLQVKTLIGTGNFTQFQEGVSDLPSGFIDVIVFPDKERTEFKQKGDKIVQTNFGETGWLYDGGPKSIRDQSPKEVEGFKQTQRTSLDMLMRGVWRNKGAVLSYIGKREAGIGKRNEVVKITYPDGFGVEFEFDMTSGLPVKALYKSSDNPESKLEERYAQFVDIQGIMTPFIIDRFADGKQLLRINYLTIEFNKPVPNSIFTKPSDIKEFKKDLKL